MRALLVIALFATPAFADDDVELHRDDLPAGVFGEPEIGIAMRRLSLSTPTAPSMSRLARTTPGETLDTLGMRMGLEFGDANGLFVGPEGEALAVVHATSMTSTDSVLLMGGAAGWRHRAGRVMGLLELAGGIGLAGDASACRGCSQASVADYVEARAGLWLHVSPVVVVGADIGASLIDRNAWSGALMIGVIGDRYHARRRH